MKVIIAGCRDWHASISRIDEVVQASGFDITTLYNGMAAGIDASARIWANHNSICVAGFKADWKKYGGSAGPRRNRIMAMHADALIAFWDGKSRGTKNMIEEMRKLKKPYRVVPLGPVTLHDEVNPEWVLGPAIFSAGPHDTACEKEPTPS